jgi:hypothetical protein
MPWLDPDRARRALDHLRSVTDELDELERLIRTSLVLADLEPLGAEGLCREIEEELADLIVVVEERVARVEGHVLTLPGHWAAAAEQHLLHSLLDHDGARGRIGGDLALGIVVSNASLLVTDHRAGIDIVTVVTRASLEAAAADVRVDPVVRAACRTLLDDPAGFEAVRDTGDRYHDGLTALIPTDAFAVEAAAFVLARNEVLRRLAPAAIAAIGRGERGPMTDQQLLATGLSRSEINELDLPVDLERVVAAAIDGGAFLHSPATARRFVEQFPVAGGGRQGFPVDLVDPVALRSLASVATADLDPFGPDPESLLWMDTIARLPESGGVRAELFALVYAVIETREQRERHSADALRPEAPGHGGAMFYAHASAASMSVSALLGGRDRFLGFSMPHRFRQDFADGGQAIVIDLVGHYREWRQHETISDPVVADAVDLYERAATETDPEQRQRLTLTANVRLALHEQTVADPYLQLPGVDRPTRWAVGAATTVWDLAQFANGRPSPLRPPGRSLDQLTTDLATLPTLDRFGNELAPPIELGRPIDIRPASNNLVSDLELCDFMTEPLCAHSGVPDEWSDFEQRLPAIAHIFRDRHTDPTLFAAVQSFIDGLPTPATVDSENDD